MYGDTLPFATAELLAGQVTALLLAGRVAQAEHLASSYQQRLIDSDDPASLGLALMALGQVRLCAGQVAAAAANLAEAAALLRQRDPVGFLGWCLAHLAVANACAGDSEGAETAVDEAVRRRPPGIRVFDAEVARARVWLAVSRGELSAAHRQAADGADLAADLGQLAFEATLLHDLVRLGHAGAVADRLGRLAGTLQGPLFPAYARHAAALQAGDGRLLEGASCGFEQAGYMLLAAEAAAQAACANDRSGRPGQAGLCAERAIRLATYCEGAVTPALEVRVPGLILTAREREIAGLAARGLTNRGIAAQLIVSVRTVETHLQNIFAKLGINRRAQLGELLFESSRAASSAAPTSRTDPTGSFSIPKRSAISSLLRPASRSQSAKP
jgi:DNA-binding CsgD family transcriptional regulator